MRHDNDAVWFAALTLFLLGIADVRAQSDEERSKAAYEQMQGAAAGKGSTGAANTAVQGQYGTKEFKGALSDPKKIGPDGKEVPAPKGAEEPDRAKQLAKGFAVVGALGGGVLTALAAGSVTFGGGAIPGWVVGAAAGGALGYVVGLKIGRFLDDKIPK